MKWHGNKVHLPALAIMVLVEYTLSHSVKHSCIRVLMGGGVRYSLFIKDLAYYSSY